MTKKKMLRLDGPDAFPDYNEAARRFGVKLTNSAKSPKQEKPAKTPKKPKK